MSQDVIEPGITPADRMSALDISDYENVHLHLRVAELELMIAQDRAAKALARVQEARELVNHKNTEIAVVYGKDPNKYKIRVDGTFEPRE